MFEKNFYIEHEEIAKLTEREVQDLRRKLGMKVLVLIKTHLLIHVIIVLNTRWDAGVP